jgi:hypothetical protein
MGSTWKLFLRGKYPAIEATFHERIFSGHGDIEGVGLKCLHCKENPPNWARFHFQKPWNQRLP